MRCKAKADTYSRAYKIGNRGAEKEDADKEQSGRNKEK